MPQRKVQIYTGWHSILDRHDSLPLRKALQEMATNGADISLDSTAYSLEDCQKELLQTGHTFLTQTSFFSKTRRSLPWSMFLSTLEINKDTLGGPETFIILDSHEIYLEEPSSLGAATIHVNERTMEEIVAELTTKYQTAVSKLNGPT